MRPHVNPVKTRLLFQSNFHLICDMDKTSIFDALCRIIRAVPDIEPRINGDSFESLAGRLLKKLLLGVIGVPLLVVRILTVVSYHPSHLHKGSCDRQHNPTKP